MSEPLNRSVCRRRLSLQSRPGSPRHPGSEALDLWQRCLLRTAEKVIRPGLVQEDRNVKRNDKGPAGQLGAAMARFSRATPSPDIAA
jgi:hypothetical protein